MLRVLQYLSYTLYEMALVCLSLLPVRSFQPRKRLQPSESNFILVTGTSTGIGRQLVMELAQKGFSVFCTVRKEKDAQSLLEQAQSLSLGQKIIPVMMDVGNPDSIRKGFANIKQHLERSHGSLVALVNNAGVSSGFDTIEEISEKVYDQVFSVNTKAVFLLSQLSIPLLKESRGRIVIVSSLAGIATAPLLGVYCMSKHALEALGDAMRLELCPFGISVSLIEPGAIKTPILDQMVLKPGTDKELAAYGKMFESLPPANVSVVTQAIKHALLSTFPMPRYMVGWDCMLIGTSIRTLPDIVHQGATEVTARAIAKLN
ncbi:hypothetical protein EDD86DRAFT_200490 [Gorgonomyces haynaldii]|nr:hypothetical protein EDD86DRAFT_200490 [Gorgonomyces haynaldii]